MRSLTATRVAARYRLLTGGIISVPPGLYQSVLEWTYAVVAAASAKRIEAELATDRGNNSDDSLTKLEQALEALESKPDWKSYSAVYELSWVFGHPGARWPVGLFQKMTPEKKATLQDKLKNLVAYLRERIAADRDLRGDSVKKKERELADLRGYMLPGVNADSTSKDFDLDLKGWIYNERRGIEQIIRDKAQAESKLMLDMLQTADQTNAMVKEMTEKFKNMAPFGEWQTIHVNLTFSPMKGAKAMWQGFTKIITLAVHDGARPRDLEGFANSLRHELQHLAQDLLSFATKAVSGLPAQNIRTPEFRQQLDPNHPGYDPKNPEAIKLLRRLREQQVNTRGLDFHSLDDVEFYTKLADSIDRFRSLWSGAKGGTLEDAVKLFTGVTEPPLDDTRFEAPGGWEFLMAFQVDRFFLALRKSAPGKWKKAVSELLKAVT